MYVDVYASAMRTGWPCGASLPQAGTRTSRALGLALNFACLMLLPLDAAWAHGIDGSEGAPLPFTSFTTFTAFSSSGADPWLAAAFGIMLAFYASGLRRMWRRSPGQGVSVGAALACLAGAGVAALALLGPIDALAGRLLAAHMAQHMLLMALAPPLLLLGRPGAVLLAALPVRAARVAARTMHRIAGRLPWQRIATPSTAMLLQAGVMWGWHLPSAMELALRAEWVHYAMHASFFAAGLLFWFVLLRSIREPSLGAGGAAIAVVGTMMQMGLLSALLTFADDARYPYYALQASQSGLTALEDQQLAGLIMWVPAALPYLIGGLMLVAAWLRRGERLDALADRRNEARARP